MDKYFYFAAQLPLLSLQQTENISSKQFFIEEASKWLSKKDIKILLSVNLDDYHVDKRNQTQKLCSQFEYEIRSEIAKYRKSLHEDFEYKVSLFPMTMLKDGSPLDVENRLLQLRWDFYEENSQGHYSDLNYLILYYLKLQILWRIMSFDKENGQKKFLDTCKIEIAAA